MKQRITRMPKILTCHRDFAEIDKFMRNVERDQVDVSQGRIVSITTDKEMYCVLTAMEGWIDCFKDLADAIGDATYNDAPMRSMRAKLNADMPLTMKLVNEVKAVVEHQRRLYMKAPGSVINRVADALLEAQ
jgi:hypothetical protein